MIEATRNPFTRTLAADVVLSTGRICTHAHLPNGAQEVLGNLTHAEWEEYCNVTRALARGINGAR